MRAAGIGTLAAVVPGVLTDQVWPALLFGLSVAGLLAIHEFRRTIR